MKFKKYSYILVLILMLLVGINRTYGQEIDITKNNKYIVAKTKGNIIMQMASSRTEDPICKELFGDKDNPNSIRGLVNDILEYPKYIVPVLVIVFGMLDLGKAVIASREDEMKKAQTTFIKRILIGIVIFFVPTILDLIMYFADLILGYTTCGL